MNSFCTRPENRSLSITLPFDGLPKSSDYKCSAKEDVKCLTLIVFQLKMDMIALYLLSSLTQINLNSSIVQYHMTSLMSRTECKYCLISITQLVG